MKSIGIICLVILNFSLHSQTKSSCIKNSNLKYSLIKTQTELLDSSKIHFSKILVKIELDSICIKEILALKTKEWIAFLENPNTDWAANLLLYFLHKKDATVFLVVKNREEWIETRKDEDLMFWGSSLK